MGTFPAQSLLLHHAAIRGPPFQRPPKLPLNIIAVFANNEMLDLSMVQLCKLWSGKHSIVRCSVVECSAVFNTIVYSHLTIATLLKGLIG